MPGFLARLGAKWCVSCDYARGGKKRRKFVWSLWERQNGIGTRWQSFELPPENELNSCRLVLGFHDNTFLEKPAIYV
jgi:hypothetical protein